MPGRPWQRRTPRRLPRPPAYTSTSMKRVVILGSTGSIGVQALDVVARSEDLQVVGMAAAGRWERLLAQADEFGVRRVSLPDEAAAVQAAAAWGRGEVLSGAEGVVRLVAESGADLVLNGLVGSAGLGPTVGGARRGHRRGAGEQGEPRGRRRAVTALAEATRGASDPGRLRALGDLPVLRAGPGTVQRFVVTASGGPFRGSAAELRRRHAPRRRSRTRPGTWAAKITIDSATLMNKGLEVIEAHHLFGIPYDRIDVVVHPESIVHAIVELNDGASLAHLGMPDMRVPISYALHYPGARGRARAALDLARAGSLTSSDPTSRHSLPGPRTRAAWPAGPPPCVLNAANEVAVHAFLGGRLASSTSLGDRGRARSLEPVPVRTFDDLYDADAEARATAASLVGAVGGEALELVPRVRGLLRADHPARVRPLHRRKGVGMRVERFAPVLPAVHREEAGRRDGVRRRGDPARRLREDHRDESGGGACLRTSRPAPTTTSRCGSGSS